jgi:16S rRNA (adenine1518-N6/adenine1519-N6)-dimethyltransferase
MKETKALLREFGIVPNRLLGQNFVFDASIFPKIAKYAELCADDTVLDAGAGLGFLTKFLADKVKKVIAVEKDSRIAEILREQVKNLFNVTVIKEDILKADVPAFNKVVSFPPYYLSSRLVIWLFDRNFEIAVLIVQKEFAERLVAPVGNKKYGWLSVVAYQAAGVELLDLIPKWMFYPPPEVDSVVIRLTPRRAPLFQISDQALFRRLVRWLFSQRNKKLGNALVPFFRSELKLDKTKAEELAHNFLLRDKRVQELAPKDFGELANVLSK